MKTQISKPYIMKKILYLLLCIFAFSQVRASAQCSPTAYTNALGSYQFIPDSLYGSIPGYLFQWSFGDGAASQLRDPIHTYPVPGTFTACCTISDTNNAIVCTGCTVVTVNPIQTNNCSISYVVDSMNHGLVYLQGSPAYPNDIILWSFSDGTNDSGMYVTHTFANTTGAQACINEIDITSGLSICQHCENIVSGGSCSFTTLPSSVNPYEFNFTANVTYQGNYTVNWTFGNSATGTGNSISHVFNAPGSYLVCMNAVDFNGAIICSFCDSVYASPAQTSCSFVYTYDAATGIAVFSTGGSAAGSVFEWHFGNGTALAGNPVTVQYNPAQTADSVCLFEYDPNTQNVICTSCQYVALGGNPPTCHANFAGVSLALNAYFIDLSNASANTSYSWDFGDGNTSTLRFPSHQYSASGFYNVCLDITDGNCQDRFCQTLFIDSVVNQPITCNAYFVVTQLSPYQMAVVNLSNGNNLAFQWSFGDGTASALAYPTHTYSSTGSFTLCLTVSDNTGCQSTFCDTLSVDSAGNIIYRSTNSGFSINVVSPSQLTGVNEISKNISSAIYPNPTTNSFRFSSADIKGSQNYRIIDIAGAEVTKGTISSSAENIRVESLSPGIYTIELTDASQAKMFGRFIKN